MRHYNNSVFSVKCIGCYEEFKSIIDEVSDDMGIYTNHENPYDHVTGAESNKRVIQERFRIE